MDFTYDATEGIVRKTDCSNPRYAHFRQSHFTAGDPQQFYECVQRGTNTERTPSTLPPKVAGSATPSVRCFFKGDEAVYAKTVTPRVISDTFLHFYHHHKKCIFVSIRNGALRVFAPFSKPHFTNTWGDRLTWNNKAYSSMTDMIRSCTEQAGYTFDHRRVHLDRSNWYANDGLVRYDYPQSEGESGVNMVHDMLQTVVASCRNLPNVDFFLNKRDFPLLHKERLKAYTHLYSHLGVVQQTPDPYVDSDEMHTPAFAPLFSMTTTRQHADTAVPTWEDWCRVAYQYDGRLFDKEYRAYPDDPAFRVPFADRKPTAIFRGASTGLGCQLRNNPRLYYCFLSNKRRLHPSTGQPYLDCGITKWNLRPRKKDRWLDIIPADLQQSIGLSAPLSLTEQAQYKYIVHLPGHSFAYRLSYELASGSVILLYPSEYKIWYSHELKPYVHYVPLPKELDETAIFKALDWCESHPQECEAIAQNARAFYDSRLSMAGVLTFWQTTLQRLARTHKFMASFWVKQGSQQLVSFKTRHVLGLSDEDMIEQRILAEGHKMGKHFRWSVNGLDLFVKSCPDVEDRKHELVVHTDCICPLSETRSTSLGDMVVPLVAATKQFLLYPFRGTETLQTYLHPNKFPEMEADPDEALSLALDRLLVHLQIICLWLCQMQEVYGFVHFDLYPWNMVLTPCSSLRNPLSFHIGGETWRVRADQHLLSHIPILIDFGRSAFVDKRLRVHHHVEPMPWPVSPIHDVRCLIVGTCHILLQSFTARPRRHLRPRWVEQMKTLLEIAGIPASTWTSAEMRKQLRLRKRFCNGLQIHHDDRGTLRDVAAQLQRLSPLCVSRESPNLERCPNSWESMAFRRLSEWVWSRFRESNDSLSTGAIVDGMLSHTSNAPVDLHHVMQCWKELGSCCTPTFRFRQDRESIERLLNGTDCGARIKILVRQFLAVVALSQEEGQSDPRCRAFLSLCGTSMRDVLFPVLHMVGVVVVCCPEMWTVARS